MFQRFDKLHNAKTGLGQQSSTIPWMSSTFADQGTTAAPVPGSFGVPNGLGQFWYDQFGNIFMLKHAAAAFTLGQVAQWNAPGTDTVSSATVRVITLTTGNLTAGAEVGNLVYDANIGASGTPKTDSLKYIKANTATTLTVSLIDDRVSNLQNDADAYTTAPAASDALTIIRPYDVVPLALANATTALPVGVAVSAITSGDYGMFQIGGLALVQSKGDVTALVAGAPVVPNGATLVGGVKGSAAQSAAQVGIATAAYAGASGVSPIWLTIFTYA